MVDFFKAHENPSMSKFNEASLKLLRINQEQIRINMCNVNLLGYDMEVGKYNYEVKFSSITSLFVEISAQLTDPEIKDVKKIRSDIKKLLKDKPIHIYQENMVTHETKINIKIENWEELEEKLFEYDLLIKKLMKKHGIALPESDDPSLAGYN